MTTSQQFSKADLCPKVDSISTWRNLRNQKTVYNRKLHGSLVAELPLRHVTWLKGMQRVFFKIPTFHTKVK